MVIWDFFNELIMNFITNTILKFSETFLFATRAFLSLLTWPPPSWPRITIEEQREEEIRIIQNFNVQQIIKVKWEELRAELGL